MSAYSEHAIIAILLIIRVRNHCVQAGYDRDDLSVLYSPTEIEPCHGELAHHPSAVAMRTNPIRKKSSGLKGEGLKKRGVANN